jgi:hypothetical protein
VNCDLPHPSIAQNEGQDGIIFENFSKIIPTKNAGGERIAHSPPAEDLTLLTLVISARQS